jgi:hypothetical protein
MPDDARPMTPTLFQRLLGASFYTLSPSLRALHGRRGRARYAGRATVVHGHGLLARAFGRIVGLPPSAGDLAVTVDFDDDAAGGETWQRVFGDFPMHSRLRLRDGRLVERIGPVQLHFSLHPDNGALYWYVDRIRLFGVVPLPASWCAGVNCRESEHAGRYEFLVVATLPIAGPLIRYRGWLEPV